MNNTRVNRIGCVPQPDGSIDIVVPAGMAAEFKKMVQRATHTWQDQSVEMRDFADRVLGREHIVGACMKPEIYGYPVIALETMDAFLPAAANIVKALDFHDSTPVTTNSNPCSTCDMEYCARCTHQRR